MNQYIAIIQQALKDFNSLLNVSVGGGLYFIVILPMAKILEVISSFIEKFSHNISLNTATDKDPLLVNFGIERKIGTKSIGKLHASMSNTVSVYSIPSGTVFTNVINNRQVQSLEDIVYQGNEFDISVEAIENGSYFFDIDEEFTTNLYGNLINSIKVKEQITGGKDIETDEELLARIQTYLSNTASSVIGLKNILLKEFPSVIDIAVENIGLDVYVYAKTSLVAVSETWELTNNKYNFRGSLLNFSCSENFSTYTDNLDNIITFEAGVTSVQVTYLTAPLLLEIQDFLNTSKVMPMGMTFIAKQPDTVFVSGNINFYKYPDDSILDNFKNYINSHGLTNFYISDMMQNISGYRMPVILNFNNIAVQDFYESNKTAYYYDNIGIIY